MRIAALLPAVAGLAVGAGPASACRLALLLALDVSSSVDDIEDRLQRNGLAAALIAPEVQAAFLSGGEPVALSAFEWSGRDAHTTLLDWTLIQSAEDLTAAAETMARSVRVRDDLPTALGWAMGDAAARLARAPRCLQATIDVSGDGVNNEGFPPRIAYRHFPLEGVAVNALAIGGGAELSDWYRGEVIRGPGAFVEVARNYADFERAMRRKLEREVAARAIGLVR